MFEFVVDFEFAKDQQYFTDGASQVAATTKNFHKSFIVTNSREHCKLDESRAPAFKPSFGLCVDE